MKLILANTDLKVNKLIKRLDESTGDIGFDTEVSGPLLRGRDFVNISHSVLLGLSVAFEDEECYYLPMRHKGNNASFMQLHEVCTRLQTHAKHRRVWAHNAKFDHQVMIQAGYPMVGMLDSMVAAWLATGKNKGIGLKELSASILGRKSPEYDPAISSRSGAEVLEYACHDALNTLQLGQHFDRSDDDWFFQECDFTYLLAKMKLQGIAIDRDELKAIREEGRYSLSQLQHLWETIIGEVSITSSKQLQILFEEGIWKEHGRTSTGAYSTNKEAITHQLTAAGSDGRALAQLRLDFQAVSKVVSTYTDGLIEEALQWRDKKLHPDLHHFGTVTGRLSSTHPNIQNQPSHGDWAQKIKSCFTPDPGMQFTSADYSQVELRYFADYCGGNLLEAFLQEKDLHQVTADTMGISRDQAKTVNFGFLLYGGGPRKLAGLLGVDEADAQRQIVLLQAGYPEIEVFRRKVIDGVSNRGPIPWCKTRAGRIRYIPELSPLAWRDHDYDAYAAACASLLKKYGDMSEHRLQRSIRSKGERLVINYLVQGGSRDLMLIGMNDYQKTIEECSYVYPSYSIITTVHDEVLTQHPDGDGETARELLKQCLEGAGKTLGLRVPIVAEPKTGNNWYEAK